LNDHPASYLNEMHQALAALLLSGPWAAHRDRHGGAFLLRGESVGAKEKVLLLSTARAVLSGEHGDLESQLERPVDERAYGDDMVLRSPSPAANPPSARPTLRFDNGFGGFSPDLREYVVLADREGETPLPWVNILASPTFGSVVSASGSSFTWSENSRENRLTPFANDPVSDPTSEALFVRDDETGQAWSPTPGPLPSSATPSGFALVPWAQSGTFGLRQFGGSTGFGSSQTLVGAVLGSSVSLLVGGKASAGWVFPKSKSPSQSSSPIVLGCTWNSNSQLPS
jgi:cyclic beta-1,2-glucan synthetase